MIAEHPLRLVAASMPQHGRIDRSEFARAAAQNSKDLMFPDTKKSLANSNWAQSVSPLTDMSRREEYERQLAEAVAIERQSEPLPLRRHDTGRYSSLDWQGLLFFATEYVDSHHPWLKSNESVA